ncbi:MAG: transcriptional regulator [Candidatus Micrarchaeota archaeon]|nr:MAG: transcriptional regulator [Candidatus Micrarchaeota archaeon]
MNDNTINQSYIDELKERIAGEITLSENPGSVMKKWREFYGITQIDLAKFMKVSPSTISDYESNRRRSPGALVIKRFVDSLIEIDKKRNYEISKSLIKLTYGNNEDQNYYIIKDFSEPLLGSDFVRLIDGKVIVNPSYLDTIKIYGYTFLDSLKVIINIDPPNYMKLFGSTTERAFIFENVSTGRSPLVVIRVAPIKPRIVVLYKLKEIDKLALKLAQLERIPLITTSISKELLFERLNRL